MNVIRSVCTNLFFPKSRASADEFRRMVAFLGGYGARRIECYCDGHDRAGALLDAGGMAGVYIAVIPLKEKRLHLCGLDQDNRRAAIRLVERAMDAAADGGFDTLMINSGARVPGREAEGLNALADSIRALFEYRDRRGHALNIEMEPCDSEIDARQLIGPYERTLAFLNRMNELKCPLRLTMDSAHTAEEKQDFVRAVTAVKPYCNHVHFANCRLDDPSDPLYGDKHLGFEWERSMWPFERLAGLMHALDALYTGEDLTIGLECLCRADDPYCWFDQTWKRLPEMFTGARRALL